jgi:MOSC domain-containing protein YiiM
VECIQQTVSRKARECKGLPPTDLRLTPDENERLIGKGVYNMVGIQKGRVLAINISEKKGMKKSNVHSCALLKDFGLEGDAHAGPWHRQVSLLANKSIEKMRAKGLKVRYGDFAENITTEGVDLVRLPIGTEIRIGNSIILRITQIGKECHERCAIYYQAGDCVMPKEGIFAEVVNEGKVKVGDEIVIFQ